MTYWIEKDSYHITKIENKIERATKVKGKVTSMKLTNSVKLYDYNKKMDREAPY